MFILLSLMCITCIAQNKKSFLRDGNEFYSDSSYTKAEIQYRKSLQKDQDYFNASFNLADAIYKQGRHEEASKLFDALKDNTSNENNLAKVYHNLGNSLFKEQKIEESIKAYKSALRINPDDDDTRYNLALSQQRKKQEEKNKEEQEQNNKEEQEQNNKEEQEQNNKEEQEQNNKEEQEGSKEKDSNNEKEKNKNESKETKEAMSKQAAEKMLEAIQQKEKDLQEELQKKKVKGKRVKVLKDW